MSAEEQRVADLLDKKERALENLAKITEAEKAWVARHKELLERFKQRMCSQGDMESFISDQIVEKMEYESRLNAKKDELKEDMGKLQIDFMKKKEMNLMDHKRTMRTFNERLRVLDDQLDDEKHTKSARDKMSVDFVIGTRKLTEEKTSSSEALAKFKSASIRDVDRLHRKERIRNEGAKGAYKEQLLAENRKSGAKATQDYVENHNRIKNTSSNTIAVLDENERLMKQQHNMKHELDVQRLAAERAKRCNEELENDLRKMVELYFEKEDQINAARASSNTIRTDKDLRMREIKQQIADSKKGSEHLKSDTMSARQDAHDMFGGDSVAWAITAALPAIRAQPELELSSSRIMETDLERNENDLELLLSALHLSSRRESNSGTSHGGTTPATRGSGLMTRGSMTSRHDASRGMSMHSRGMSGMGSRTPRA